MPQIELTVAEVEILIHSLRARRYPETDPLLCKLQQHRQTPLGRIVQEMRDWIASSSGSVGSDTIEFWIGQLEAIDEMRQWMPAQKYENKALRYRALYG